MPIVIRELDPKTGKPKPKKKKNPPQVAKRGGAMKKKGMRRGGAMKSKGMKKGGKMPMAKDPDTGKMVPAFAVDGKGKMRKGGMMKKKGYAKGGSMKKKGYASGGKMSSKSMASGLKKFLDAGGFGSMKPAEISPIMKELKKLESLRKKRMGGMMKKKGMKKGGVMRGTGAATIGKKFTRAG